MAANNKLSIKLKNFKNSGSYSRGVSVCLHKLKEKTLTQKNITERTVKKKNSSKCDSDHMRTTRKYRKCVTKESCAIKSKCTIKSKCSE